MRMVCEIVPGVGRIFTKEDVKECICKNRYNDSVNDVET